jgi:hypothetical protein
MPDACPLRSRQHSEAKAWHLAFRASYPSSNNSSLPSLQILLFNFSRLLACFAGPCLIPELTEQSRLAWIDDGSSIRVVPLPEGPRKYGRGIAKGMRLSQRLLAQRAKDKKREQASLV